VWGGIECTHNRVSDRWFDQLDQTGHTERIDDLDRVAALGITTLRYPVLWERVVSDGDLRHADWSWTDARLARLRDLGVRPIVGLLHHGNGPAGTDLLDPGFPSAFAAFAHAVALRYPDVDTYMPINEPLTTARFCGLYGFWYPHRRDLRAFARILMHQIQATKLAIEQIRRVRPGATFVQNEDLGTTHSTPLLAYEAAFQNHRRWLTFDLLCGRVDDEHPLRPMLEESGIGAGELDALVASPMTPDVIGIDHYVTSERYLDESLDRYPDGYHSGNGIHRYADVEAVRSRVHELDGVQRLLARAWGRYRLPIAVTEAHLASTRDEQIRWLVEMWDAAGSLKRTGVDVRAITVWSLFGAYGWNTLVTTEGGTYENGAFDVSGNEPRRTAVASAIESLARSGDYRHPVLATSGWWRRADRIVYGDPASGAAAHPPESSSETPVFALLTTPGAIADAIVVAARQRGLAYERIDIADPAADIRETLEELGPWAIVDAVGVGRRRLAVASSMHTAAASAAARHGLPFVMFSSFEVFDRDSDLPRHEGESPDATTAVGRAWADAEHAVRLAYPDGVIARAGPLLGSEI
jgi:dTDP-4-dehydrorhamnose reductase